MGRCYSLALLASVICNPADIQAEISGTLAVSWPILADCLGQTTTVTAKQPLLTHVQTCL